MSEHNKHSDREPESESTEPGLDFVRTAIKESVDSGRALRTRFPPEPNGYLHIGHAKAICLNFGVAQEFGGTCNLRFDDTNPEKESEEYVRAIQDDVRWLGFDWGDRLFFASDYYEQLYEWAERLVEAGKAYVDSVAADAVGELRGPWHEEGQESPYRNRSVEENLGLLRRMRAGEFKDGEHALRAKIDMASGNMNLRDPIMYRIRHVPHHRTGGAWCLYPTYDWAHGQSDALEGITHSLCTLEFEDHRPLYDWYLDQLPLDEIDALEDGGRPRQIEFARLNLTYTMLSKRRLRELVEEGVVDGWDDPRMPTLAAFRRRGFTPESIRNLCNRVGLTKRKTTVEIAQLEHALREDLNLHARRYMAVLDPLRVVIENYPEDVTEEMDLVNNPEDESAGTRKVPFSRVLFIEREDFMMDPPKKFFRLAPGREVRLRNAYLVTCREALVDENGDVTELRCTYDPATRGGSAPDGRRVKATLHWVSAEHSLPAEVRLYDRLFTEPFPDTLDDWKAAINPQALEVRPDCRIEPALGEIGDDPVQFERLGYFKKDPDTTAEKLVFNRAVALRDSWAKIDKQRQQKKG